MAFSHFLLAFRPKQDAVAIYGVLPPSFRDSPETDDMAALYSVSRLPYGVSPGTKRSSGYLRRSPLIYGGSPETNVAGIIYFWYLAKILWRFAIYL